MPSPEEAEEESEEEELPEEETTTREEEIRYVGDFRKPERFKTVKETIEIEPKYTDEDMDASDLIDRIRLWKQKALERKMAKNLSESEVHESQTEQAEVKVSPFSKSTSDKPKDSAKSTKESAKRTLVGIGEVLDEECSTEEVVEEVLPSCSVTNTSLEICELLHQLEAGLFILDFK